MTLSEEFLPTLGESRRWPLQGKRSLDELYLTGATIANGQLHAISAAYGTLITIDLASRQVVAAQAVPGLAVADGDGDHQPSECRSMCSRQARRSARGRRREGVTSCFVSRSGPRPRHWDGQLENCDEERCDPLAPLSPLSAASRGRDCCGVVS